jgi:colanic acid/amylovoran biosynthesis glycosyltransferase
VTRADPIRYPVSGIRYSFAYLFERFPSFVQTFVYREAAEMVRQKMDPLLVSVRRPDDPGELAQPVELDTWYLPEEKELRTEVDTRRATRTLAWRPHRAIPRHRVEPDAQRMFEAIWLAPVLREHGIRHVHAHFGGLAARMAWWLRKLYGFTYSYTGHANDIFCDTGFPVSNADLARSAKFIVTETDYARRWMEERHPFARGKVVRVFNGIDPAGFFPREPAQEGISTDGPGALPRILSIGRYVEKKGFDVLIDACAKLRERDIAFTCEIVGGGPLHEVLATQIARLDLGNCVHLLGPRSQAEVRRLLATTQLFVLACQPDSEGGSDNLPTVIAEAMLAGVPVISTPLAGVPEMIADGQDGVLVPVRDVAKLAATLADLLADPVRALAMAARGRASANARFAIEQTTRELKHLLVRRAHVSVPEPARALDPELPRRWWSW